MAAETTAPRILRASLLGAALTLSALGAGYLLAPWAITTTASVLSLGELVATGPDELTWARLKLGLAFATAPAGAWLATVVAQGTRTREGWLPWFGASFALIATAVCVGIAARTYWVHLALESARGDGGHMSVVGVFAVGDVAPGGWGLGLGILAAGILAIVAFARARRP